MPKNAKKKLLYLGILLILLLIGLVIYSENIKSINIIENIKKGLDELTGNTENSSEELILTSKVNLEAANGKGGVDLDWSSYNQENKIFKAYQKKEGADNFETISTVDFYKEIEPIKVLNVYPENTWHTGVPVPPTVTFRYLDGKTEQIRKSAALKLWMEGGTMIEGSTSTTFDAYGKNPITGQQIINVTPISISSFNNNPEVIWNYDIVMFGTWDGNGGEDDLVNDDAIEIVEKYINSGYGILTGHDSIGFRYYNVGLSKLRKYFNIETGWWKAMRPANMTDIDHNAGWTYISSTITVNKNGLLTNFPYEITLGTQLKIPETHTTSQAALGNVWMTLINGIEDKNNGQSISSYKGKGNPYYYLTTWNNTAMIQTGNSNCESTDDERKVLANTLFYLKQRTTETAFTDNSAQDLKGPDAPTINNPKKAENNQIKLTYNAKDQGNTYTYYIEAYDETNNTAVIATSNQVTETVTTGTQGYYYIIDNNSSNINFDINTATYTENKEIITDISNNGKYIHMKAMDKAGNIGEESTTKIEVIVLTSKMNLSLSEGKGGVELNWSNYDKTNRYFVIYRKKENEENFETIVSLNDKYSSNTYVDKLGNDLNSPAVPEIEVKETSENNIKITATSEDKGTKYTYYIEAYDVNNLSLLSTSKIETKHIR